MKTLIAHIFETLGEATAMATALGDPIQTVHSWKANGSIPPWRRSDVLRLRPVDGKSLSPAALSYLTSRERKPDMAA